MPGHRRKGRTGRGGEESSGSGALALADESFSVSSSVSESSVSTTEAMSEHERHKLYNAYMGPSGLVDLEVLSLIDPTSFSTDEAFKKNMKKKTNMCLLLCSCMHVDSDDDYDELDEAVSVGSDKDHDKTKGNGRRDIRLPAQSAVKFGKKTLVLDMDETLIHSTFTYVKDAAQIQLTVNNPATQGKAQDGKGAQGKAGNYTASRSITICVLFRPYVEDFLLDVYPYYELVIFTASMKEYADKVLALLEERVAIRAAERGQTRAMNELFSAKRYRDDCERFNQTYVKNLDRLGRDIKNIIILDNSPSCYMLNTENGIPSNTWRGEKKDMQLKKLVPILISLSSLDDVRSSIGTPEFQMALPK